MKQGTTNKQKQSNPEVIKNFAISIIIPIGFFKLNVQNLQQVEKIYGIGFPHPHSYTHPASSIAIFYLYSDASQPCLQPRLICQISNLIIQRQRHNSTLPGCSTGRSNSRKTKWNASSPVNLSPSSISSTDKWASSQMPTLKIWETLCSFSLILSMGNL